MIKIKKIIYSLICVALIGCCSNKAECTGSEPKPKPKPFITTYIGAVNPDTIHVQRCDEYTKNRMATVKDSLSVTQIPSYNIILDASTYPHAFRADDYEVHHLISQHFCKNYGYNINSVPCVTIPKEVHYRTGSHVHAGHNINDYFAKEKAAFNSNGLHEVFELSINDLQRAFIECGYHIDIRSCKGLIEHIDRARAELLRSTPPRPADSRLKFVSTTPSRAELRTKSRAVADALKRDPSQGGTPTASPANKFRAGKQVRKLKL